jgi:glycosyltransferase involved in cell wall biosynthesis
MKIAVWHNLPSGGGKRALHQHVRGLVGRGHSLEAWTLSNSDRSYLPLSALIKENIIAYEEPRPGRFISAVSGALASWRNEFSQMRAFDEACARSAAEIEGREFDLVFVNSAAPYYMPYVLRHLQRLPSVLYLQEPCRPLYEANPVLPWVGTVNDKSSREFRNGLRGVAYDWMHLSVLRAQARHEWQNAQACTQMLVNSYFSRESIVRAYGRDARVCYLGIDTDQFHPLDYEREDFVISVGAFNRAKGADTAIEAVAQLSAPCRTLKWVANFSDDQYLSEMTALAEKHGVDLQVMSNISDPQLLDLLNRAAAFVYAPRLEPFGYAPLEANACGTPVVAVAEGGIREVVRDGLNGLLVDREPAKIAAALDKLLLDRNFARQMGGDAAQFVRSEWGLEQSVTRLEERLAQVLSSIS